MNLQDAAIVPDFKWVFVMGHWDIHLTGMCEVGGEIMFFRLEQGRDQRKGDLVYAIYRFPESEKQWFLNNKAEFERQVGTHWTYGSDGKRGPRYVPKPEFAGPNGVPLFYSSPRVYDFDEVANRSECVGKHVVWSEEDTR
jgi:hypothetical protein